MPLKLGVLRAEDRIVDLNIVEVADAIRDVLAEYESQFAQATNLFVSETITHAQEHIDQTSIDEGQDVDRYGRTLETRVTGGYNVAYPWFRRGWAHGWDYEAYKYLTVADVAKVLTAQTRGNSKWRLRTLFRALFNNAQYAFKDQENKLDLTILPLANGDAQLYSPSQILGLNETSATADHYVVSGYVSSGMSGTNNPLEIIRAKFAAQFPGTRIVAFINTAQLPDIRQKLPNFIDANYVDATVLSTEKQPINVPGINVPGTYVGVDGDTNVHVYTYDSAVVSTYILGLPMGQAPLKRRVPMVAELQGFKLEAEEDFYPLHRREFRDRQGYAPGNRLGAVVVQLKASGTYDTPALYSL